MTVLAAVTVFHGRHDHLRWQQLSLAQGSRRPDLRVLVAMADEPPLLAPCAPETTLVREPVPAQGLPLARARNRGVETALAHGADTVVLLDVDVLVAADTLAAYDDAVSTEPGTIWSGPVTYLDAATRPGPELIGHLDRWDAPHPARPAPPVGTRIGGADPDLFWSLAFALSAPAWRRSGGFHEGYVGYGGEDTDFARGAQQRGLDFGWDGSARAYHQHHHAPSPPVQHLDDILRNAALFHDRWHTWPMSGWLDEFARQGLIEWREDRWRRTRALR